MNNTYDRILDLVIDEISAGFAAKVAGKVTGKARHAADVADQKQKKREIVNNPEGGSKPDYKGNQDPDGTPRDGWTTHKPTPRTKEHDDADDYASKKHDQSNRIKAKFAARAAADGAGKGAEGRRGTGVNDREGKKATKKFDKNKKKSERATRRKLGSGAGRLRSALGKIKSRKFSKTDDAHKEHFDKVKPREKGSI